MVVISNKEPKTRENFTVIDYKGVLSTSDSEAYTETSTDSETDTELASAIEQFSFKLGLSHEADAKRVSPLLEAPNKFYDRTCEEYMRFTDNNPSTYHAISYFGGILAEHGFEKYLEQAHFEFSKKGGKYYVTRGQQSLVAFVIGGNWKPENGIGVVGCHADSLTAKLKPISVKSSESEYLALGVAPYSGSLNHLWLDRDLGIAGSVIIKTATGKVVSRLVSSGRHPICRIPSLAPHFGATPFPYNKETKMVPIMGFGVEDEPATEDEKLSPLYGKHSLLLLRYIADLANAEVLELLQLDLELYDVQSAVRGGVKNDFMFAPRIDDRLCSFSAIHGLLSHSDELDLKSFDGFLIVLLANHEEIGSGSRTGAKGKFLNSVVERVIEQRGLTKTSTTRAFANSVILSADVTHALNPNFSEYYLKNHAPVPNTGLTIKMDANGHVMTDLTGVVLMEMIAKYHDLKLQTFHIRNDKPSGGTIGPMLAVDTGARVIDVGLSQLSMHSIRAAAGYKEAGIGQRTFQAFFDSWRQFYDRIDYS